MQVKYVVSRRDIERAATFYGEWSGSAFVVRRRQRNVEGKRERLSRGQLWEAIITALLTSQQRSGPDSPVNSFICAKPFPLRLQRCEAARDISVLARKAISRYRGIRRGPTIAGEIRSNLRMLTSGGWDELLGAANDLLAKPDRSVERESARKYAAILDGVGPKQSRNILQMLGLTRYEIPLDSRIVKWLKGFGFPVSLSPTALGDEGYYSFVEDGVQAVCEAIGVLPCLMDAAIFASFDGEGWDNARLRW